MAKKILSVFLAILIIFTSVFISYQEAYANPLLLLVEGVASALGLSTGLTGALFASFDTNKGLSIQKLQDAEVYKGLTISQIKHIACGLYGRNIQATELQGAFLVEVVGKVKDYLLQKFNLTQNSDNSISYTIPSAGNDVTIKPGSYSPYGYRVGTAEMSTLKEEIQDTSLPYTYFLPIDTLAFTSVNTKVWQGSGGYSSGGTKQTIPLLSLPDGIWGIRGALDSSVWLQVRNVDTNQTYSYKYQTVKNKPAILKLETVNGSRVVTLGGVSVVMDSSKYFQLDIRDAQQNSEFPVVADKFLITQLAPDALQDLGVYGDVITIPKTATAESVYGSLPVRDANTKTIDYTSSAVIPEDVPTNPPAGQTEFWNTVTGFIGSYWSKFNSSFIPLVTAVNTATQSINTLGATIVTGLTGTIIAENDKIRQKLAEESALDRANAQTQAGAIVGSVDGVKDSVDSLRESVDSLTDTTTSEINWEPLRIPGTLFTTKFPFSLPWDVLRTFQALLIDNPSPPIWEVKWRDEVLKMDFSFNIDLTRFDTIFKVAKVFVLVALNVGLIFGTRKLLGGAT